MTDVFIIAEAGINHDGLLSQAYKLVDIAKDSGANAVKFQTWNTDLLVAKDAEQAAYQTLNTGIKESQYEMLKKVELSYDDFNNIKNYCDERQIEFMSTADEYDSANFLNTIQNKFKIGSGELNNIKFLKQIAEFNKDIILSTGMGTLTEVSKAVDSILETGFSMNKLTLLHATTNYPTLPDEVNLRAMLTLMHAFPGVKVGYSDHTIGNEISSAAVAIGARVIEKHITINKALPGADHKASSDPEEFASFVQSIRNVSQALGDGIKKPSLSELKNKEIVRKVLYAASDIFKGERITEEKIIAKRSSADNAIKVDQYFSILNTVAIQDFKAGDILVK